MTFDFWNTLMAESPSGLVEPRVTAWVGILEEAGIPVEVPRVDAAHQVAFRSYQASWRANEQYRVAEATEHMLAALDLEVPTATRNLLVDAFHDAGIRTELRLCPGVEACLYDLHEAGIRLAIVCDIGLTPSITLRHHLAKYGLLDRFSSFAFSDEVGVYKPSPEIFWHALHALEVEPDRTAHVGDRRRTDVAGALALGMVAVRYIGVYDDPDEGPSGDHVVGDLAEVPAVLGIR